MKNYKTYQIANLLFNSCERFKKINLGLTFSLYLFFISFTKKTKIIEYEISLFFYFNIKLLIYINFSSFFLIDGIN